MALFGKKSKKEKNDIDQLAQKAERLLASSDAENAKENASNNTEPEPMAESVKKEEVIVPDKKKKSQRFTLLVEDAFQLKENGGVVVGGNVHGTVYNHEKVYILHPILGDVVQAKIEGIEDGPMNMVDSAKDTKVGLKFTSIKNRNEIPRYSVITNIRPLAKPSKEDPDAESPFLLGLCCEYDRLIKEGAFQHIFTFAVFSANYLTPVKLDVDMSRTTEDKAVLKQNSKISFKLIRKPGEENVLALPVFTDYYELKKWENAYEGNEQPQNFFMSFNQAADIGLKNSGFVINPFGDFPVFVSVDNINHIIDVKNNLDKRIAEEKDSMKE